MIKEGRLVMLNRNLLRGFTLRSVISMWHTATRSFRLKIRGNDDFADTLLNHREKDTVQAVQGMWQAYGQMRAARTLARGAVAATGVGGVGLWIYQQTLSQQRKKIEDLQKELDATGLVLIKAYQNTTDRIKEEEGVLAKIDEVMSQNVAEIGSLEQNSQELDDALTFSQLQAELIVLLEKHVEGAEGKIRQFFDKALNTPDDPNHQAVVNAYNRNKVTKAVFDTYGVTLRVPSPENAPLPLSGLPQAGLR